MSNSINVYVFSSKSITNIWAGYGASTWAVALGSEATNKGKITKSQKMPVGSFGILYCEPWKAFTVPFVTCSTPDQNRTEGEIWAENWMLPFKFRALGNPRKKFLGSDVLSLPGAAAKQITNYSNYLTVQGNFAFQPSTVDARDWETLVTRLV
ncbi:hypothetical protein ACIQUG_15985 [Ensifer sp. NPDC090286]|uniref:hypothetical protein n=1 Tax=Ensifer sp. NPDC090286 TaxID=3363991 RepID=UPI00383B9487